MTRLPSHCPLISRTRRRVGSREEGQVVPLLTVVLVIVLVVALLIAQVAGVVTDRTRARAAADAAALAGTRDGRPGAQRLASLNGGELVGYSSVDATVEVRVRVGDAEASARATADARPPQGEDDPRGGVPYTDKRVGHPADE
jgi:hypothetical protein